MSQPDNELRHIFNADTPYALMRAMNVRADGTYTEDMWTPHADEWYWDLLLSMKPFRSIYACDGNPSPLISARGFNISQTPREECELEGLCMGGPWDAPGAKVLVHGLKSAPHFNFAIGRILPLTGRFRPAAQPGPGRLPVRLITGEEIACKPENLKPIALGPPTASVASNDTRSRPAPKSSSQPANKPSTPSPPPSTTTPSPGQRLAELIHADVRSGSVPPLMTRESIRRCGLADGKIICVTCGSGSTKEFIALARVAPPSLVPIPEAVRFQCLPCLIRSAERLKVRPTAKAVQEYVDERIMGAMEAASVLMGHARMSYGSRTGGSGQWY